MEDAPMWDSDHMADPEANHRPSSVPAAGVGADRPAVLVGGGSSVDLSGSHAGTGDSGAWVQISSPETAPGHTGPSSAAQRALHFGGWSRQQSHLDGEPDGGWAPATSYPDYMPHALLDTASSEEGEKSPSRYLLSPAVLPAQASTSRGGQGGVVLQDRVPGGSPLTPPGDSTSGHTSKNDHGSADMQAGSPGGLIQQRGSSTDSMTSAGTSMITPFWHRRPLPSPHGGTSGARSTPTTCEITPVESDSPGPAGGSVTPMTAPAHGGTTGSTYPGPSTSARPSTPPLTAPASTSRLRHAGGPSALRNTLTSQQLHAQFREGWGLGPAASGGQPSGSGSAGISHRGPQQAGGRPELWDELFAATTSVSTAVWLYEYLFVSCAWLQTACAALGGSIVS
jgi:hypothetical protein